MKKRLFSLLLCLCMALTLLPTAAWAAEAPAATLAWTEGGQSKSAQLTGDEVRYGMTGDYLRDADPAAGAALTLLADTAADLGFEDISPVTLTSGDGGPYTLSRDMADDGHSKTGRMLHVSDGTSVTVTDLTLDGSAPTEPPYCTDQPRFITVYGELTLGEGATIQNCQPSSNYGNPGLPPAAVRVDGALTMKDGSKIVDNQARNGGVVESYGSTVSLSGNVTIKGNQAVDLSEVYSFDESALAAAPRTPANLVMYKTQRKAAGAPIQVTGALTGGEGSIGLTLLYTEMDPEPTTGKVAEGAGYTLTDTDLAAFFSDRPGYFLDLNTEENAIYLDQYAITTQPTNEAPTVAVNQTKGAAYQWHPASTVTETVTDQNASLYETTKEDDNNNDVTVSSSYADGKWTAAIGDWDSGYFTMPLKKGDSLAVTIPTNAMPTTMGQLGLYDKKNYEQLWYYFRDFAPDEGVTAAEDGDNTVITYTVSADGTYTLMLDGLSAAPDISATVTGIKLGAAVSGQTGATLSAPTAGDYLCRVSWPDGTALQSDLVSVTAPPHRHAVSVECETDSGTQETFQALTMNDEGKLCVNGEALASNTLSGGSYYLPEDITLNASITVIDADSAPVSLCLNGHTLDLGEGCIDIDASTNRGNGVLDLCDCGATGKVISAHYGGYANAATIEVSYQFSLYGGTVENTAASGSNKNGVGFNGGTANLYGGKLVSQHGSGLWVNPWQADSLTLSGNVAIQGGADKAEVSFSSPSSTWEDNIRFTLTGPLTQPAAPWRVAVADGTPMPLVDGWSQHMDGKNFDDYFRSATQGLFVGRRENGDLELAQYAITQQPAADNGYTVHTNGAPASVPAYQWYPATVTTADVTGENATAYYDDMEGESAAYDAATKLWSGVGWFEYRYFTIHLAKGDQVTVKPDAQLAEHTTLGLTPEPYNYSYLVRLYGDEANEAGEYVLTAPAESDYIFYCESGHRSIDSDGAPSFSARVKQVKLGTPLTGQTAAKLTAAEAGNYLCQVTWPDGTALNSNIVAYVPPAPGEATGEVEWKPGTPEVAVDTDALKDLAGEVQAGDTVTVKLTVEKQEAPADKDDIQGVVTGNKDDVLYLDLSLLKQVNDADPEPITNTGEKVLEIAVDYDFTGKKDVTVYRKHGEEQAAALNKLTARPADNFADGSFFADSANGKVYIYASKFSTYAIGYTAQSSAPAPGGSPARPNQPEKRPALPFTDVQATDDCYENVKYVYEKGWMLGTSETTFAPDGELTRAMLATVLYRAAGSPQVEGKPAFEDALPDVWYSDAVVWASQTHVLRGYGNGKFGPEDVVSREMLNMVIARQQGEDPAWTGAPALALPATRAEIAAMLARFYAGEK